MTPAWGQELGPLALGTCGEELVGLTVEEVVLLDSDSSHHLHMIPSMLQNNSEAEEEILVDEEEVRQAKNFSKTSDATFLKSFTMWLDLLQFSIHSFEA